MCRVQAEKATQLQTQKQGCQRGWPQSCKNSEQETLPRSRASLQPGTIPVRGCRSQQGLSGLACLSPLGPSVIPCGAAAVLPHDPGSFPRGRPARAPAVRLGGQQPQGTASRALPRHCSLAVLEEKRQHPGAAGLAAGSPGLSDSPLHGPKDSACVHVCQDTITRNQGPF